MQRIQKIILKNFKFFYGEKEIILNRQNALIYGENGSGKSSFYWALYTFLQSPLKDDPKELFKYFDTKNNQNLVNRFAVKSEDSKEDISFIKVVFENDHRSETTEMLSGSVVGAKNSDLVKKALQASDLFNYKLLSKIQNHFSNRNPIDLFPLMEGTTLPFISFRQPLERHDGKEGTSNAQEWWNYLEPGPKPKRPNMHTEAYKTFQTTVGEFNEQMKRYLRTITESVNDYLKKFQQDYEVFFEYKKCTYDRFKDGSTTTRIHETQWPRIYLGVRLGHEKLGDENKNVTRPHSFLNEAKLTAIALAIRFAMLDEKLSGTEAEQEIPQLLVVDDILISLDMSNRDIVLDLILTRFKNYQILIFTHDRLFYAMAQNKIKGLEQRNWKFIEMYSQQKNGIPQPLMYESKSYLGKAKTYLEKNEYEIAGNFLRKEAEEICKEFLPDRLRLDQYGSKKPLALCIQASITFFESNGLDPKLFKELNSHREFVLNPSSHDSYDVPKFDSEIRKCIETVEKLREIKVDNNVFSKGEILTFSHTTEGSNPEVWKCNIRIHDDFRIIVVKDKEPVLASGMINYKIYKNGKIVKENGNRLRHGKESLKTSYDKWYSKSDKWSPADFWDGITIIKSGEPIRNLLTNS